MEPQTIALLSIGLNAILAVLAFLFRGALADRDRRLERLERDQESLKTRLTAAEILSVTQGSRIDAIYVLLERIETSIERIFNKLDKE